MADSGFFQLNDVVLNIPPERIIIEKRTMNYSWQALRTTSSIKTKSGYSQLDITVKAMFTGENFGYEKLRNLVAQFRVTPFCYVENKYIRDQVMGGIRGKNMALALKSMTINKVTDEKGPDVVEVIFYFCWFNYLPYTSDFTFKSEPFLAIEVRDPRKSKAWQIMYQAEINRAKTLYKGKKGLYEPIIDGTSQPTKLEFTEYKSLSLDQYNYFKREKKALRKLRNLLKKNINNQNDMNELVPRMYNTLMSQDSSGQDLLNTQESNALMDELFGKITSISKDLEDRQKADEAAQELFRLLNKQISNSSGSRFRNVLNDQPWEATFVGKDSETVSFNNRPDETTKDKSSANSILVERKRVLEANSQLVNDDLILTGISISFQNILAVLPVKGFTFPTFQHIGSVDAVVNLSFIATNEVGAKQLNEFFNIIEEQANTLKQVPQGHRNLSITNDLINMCGLAEFIPDSMATQTMPGTPGHSSVTMTLLNNPLTSTTREKLVDSNAMASNYDYRQKIAKILESNLRLIDHAFQDQQTQFGDTTTWFGNTNGRQLRSLTTTSFHTQSAFASGISPKDRQKANEIIAAYPTADANPRFIGSGKPQIEVLLEAGYFVYNGSTDSRDGQFQELCKEYGRKLGHVLKVVSQDILGNVETTYGYSGGSVAQFFSLTDKEVPSISLLQEIISDEIAKNKKLFGSLNRASELTAAERQRIAATRSSTLEANYVEDQRRILQAYRNNSLNRQTIQLLTDKEKYQKAINQYKNDVLNEWISWSKKFINEKILSSSAIELPQFENVLAEIDLAYEQNQITAYPDFPLAEVANILQTDKEYSLLLQNMLQKKLKSISTNRLKVKPENFNLASLIGPDFYFFDRFGDTRSGFIGPEVIEAARDSVKESQTNKRANAENDWFREVYNKQILGDEQATEIDKAKVGLGKGFFTDAIKETFNRLNVADEHFVASDLINEEEDGLACFTAATLKRVKDAKPVEIKPIKTGWEKEQVGWTANNREGGSLTAPNHYAEAKHKYGVDAIDFLLPSANTNPVFKQEDGIEWSWPTGPQTRRITSPFQPEGRAHPDKTDNQTGKAIIRPHNGMDLGSTDQRGSNGHPVYAVADGEITHISFSPHEWEPGVPSGDAGNNIRIKHKNGYVTRYMHLQWDDIFEELSSTFWGRGLWSNEVIHQSPGSLPVDRGIRIGSIGNSGTGTAPHLHFELKKNGKHIDPEIIFKPQVEKLTEIFTDADPQNKSLLTRSAEQFEKDLTSGQGFGMIRAYPTYRLYFIESDLNERKRYQFDDFFHYSSVVSIELIRSRKLAADLLVMRLTNTSGVLNNRKFKNTLNPDKARDASGKIAKEESSIASLMLKPGTQIQLAIGYSNDVSQLEIPFNGIITDIQFTGNDEIIDITCQSFGVQLVRSTHGKVKKFGGFLSDSGITGEICEQLLAEPEITHFGRWTPGEAPPLGGFRSVLTDRWTFTPQPADDNIFAPTGRGVWGIFDSTPDFILYNSTVWDAMQELTLRHPSMVAYPVPYEGRWGPRMTMFFGTPDQLYFARDPSVRELSLSDKLRKIGEEAALKLGAQEIDQLRDANVIPDASLWEKITGPLAAGREKAKEFFVDEQMRRLALNTGIIKPFRNYHLINSSQHILHNNISSVLHNVFNTVTIQYDNDGPEVDDDGNGVNGGFLNFDSRDTFTLRCDAALPDEEVRELFAQFPNCVGEEMAKRYCLSLLKNSLKEGYKGSVTIIGNPNIKPYDICYIFDQHNDMYGPIEVEQVVLSFSQKTGFITEITPDMCIHVNEHTTMATQDALGLIAENWMKQKYSISNGSNGLWTVGAIGTGLGAAAIANAGLATAGVAGLVAAIAAPISNMFFNSSEIALGQDPTANPLKLIGGFIFSKAITRTQFAHPMRYSPLVKGGEPMLGGLPEQMDITFVQGMKKWFKNSYQGAGLLINDTIDKLSPNAWADHQTGDFWKSFKDTGKR